MWTRHRKHSKLRLLILPVLCCCALGYFYYHANHGTYGLEAMESYDATIAELSEQLEGLTAEVDVLKHRTSLLRNGSLERDIVDEQARKMLGLTRANEIVIILD